VYLHEGKPVSLDSLKEKVPELSDEKLAALRETYGELAARLQQTMKQTRQLARDAKSNLDELRRNFAADLIELHLIELRERHTDDRVQRYFDEVVSHLLDTLAAFGEASEADADAFRVYGVNLLVDHAATQGAPIVFESAPNVRSLFGTIERPSDSSRQAAPDFMHVKSGSILEADGGYLLFNIGDAAHDTEVWPTLKRTLKNATLTIQAHETALTVAGVSLKPEPIPIKVKVIVVGDLEIYHLLYELDEDFRKIFKVKAEFDSVMKRSDGALMQMAHFVRGRCRAEGLLPFDRSGVAGVIEEAVRLTGRRDKISTRFSEVADVVREACYWAKQTAAGVVCEEHVDQALRERRTRLNLIEEKYQEAFIDGTLLIDADGERVGTVNGLTYLDGGDYGFGHPVRITAITSMGRAGIINIEREVELSGKAHSKGVLILEGFLRSRYAQDKPLSMSASIAFEQSYSNVDGDSASSTEVYALISSLSRVSIRQGLAVTGSVNQHGEVQPIGSVNEKIEAFFDLCKKRGLTGNQGVLIPRLNETDLMLTKEVVENVHAGRFHIYPIHTIDEGLEILTGVRAGQRGPDGLYEEGTINRLVDDRLIELAEGLREFGEQPDGDEGDHDGD
jgi:ATP-dependent Lon protease